MSGKRRGKLIVRADAHKSKRWAINKRNDELAASEKNTGGEGYIYVARLGRENLYKVSRAKDLQERMKEIRKEYDRATCVYSAWVKDAPHMLKPVQDFLDELGRRVERDVFRLELGDLAAIDAFVRR